MAAELSERFDRLPEEIQGALMRQVELILGMSEAEKLHAAYFIGALSVMPDVPEPTQELAAAFRNLVVRADEIASPETWRD